MMKVQKSRKYKQPEGVLSEAFEKTGRHIGGNVGSMASVLEYMGNAQRQIADARAQMDLDVNEQFLDPLRQYLKGEMQEVSNHKKKFKSRRLDYDVKKRDLEKKRDDKSEEAYRIAEGKFEESKELAMQGMVQLQNGEGEQISQLRAFAAAQRRFHEAAIGSLDGLLDYLDGQVDAVNSGPRREYSAPASAIDYGTTDDSSYGGAGGYSGEDSYGGDFGAGAPAVGGFDGYGQDQGGAANGKEQLRALYDFEAEQPGELNFFKDDIIQKLSDIDENWMEGELNGEVGMFPSTYVEVMQY